ncbi:protein ENHANCED DOWNY MILDEW 2-like isoform X2 [Aristolochia californica]
MESSEDEEEIVPKSVNNYHFVDNEGEPICFSVLPLKLDDEESQEDSSKQVFLRGIADDGLQRIYKQIIAWKVQFEEQPEISVLSKEKYWIKLQKPRKSFEDTIRAILITIRCLHFLKTNPEAPAKVLWDSLKKVFSSYDDEPSEFDLLHHQPIIKAFVEKDEALRKSKLLPTLLEEPRKRNSFDQDFLISHDTKKFKFIIDDDGNDDVDDDEDVGDKAKEELFDTVCAICDNGGKILCCEGKCMRSFHPIRSDECHALGLTEAEVEDLEKKEFLCPNCLHKQHQCFACGKLGSSDKAAKPEVFPCVSATCGYFYHPECVSKLLHPGNETEIEDLKNKIASGDSFTCPVHKCCICKHGENKDVKDLQFAICRRCPKAYHRKCLPRKISFEDSEDDDSDVRAWDDLIPNRILIYCLKHAIDPELGTPVREHIIFPGVSQKKKATVSSKMKVLAKKKKESPCEDYLEQKSVIRSSKAIENVSSAVKSERRFLEESFRKPKISGSFKEIVKGGSVKLFQSKASLSSKVEPNKAMKAVESATVELDKGLALAKSGMKGSPNSEAVNASSIASVKKKPSVLAPVVDEQLKEKILGIMKKSSFLTLAGIHDKHKKPSAQYHSSRNVDKTITQGKVECSVEAIRIALKKLEEGATLEDAKAVCETQIINQVIKWKNKLQIYLSPFLHGMRYTSYGRHFTKVDKLKEIVEKLRFYVQNGDMIVDFCCGANDFSRLMKEKLDEIGKKCFFKNYDFIQPKNDFCFEKRDWMTVQKDELPTGSQLIMGLNPPFGVRGALANRFIDKALEFKPKLLILIAPKETERLDKKEAAYDLIWEDDCTLSGKSFYLPGSVDVYDKQMEQWNEKPPLLYLWSRPDWTAKHRIIAGQQGHTSKVVEQRCFENGLLNPMVCDLANPSDDQADQLVEAIDVNPENKDPLSKLITEMNLHKKYKSASPEYSKDSMKRHWERTKEMEQRDERHRYHGSPKEEQRIEESRNKENLKEMEKRDEKSGYLESLKERKQRGEKRSLENLKHQEKRDEKKLKVAGMVSASGVPLMTGSQSNRSDSASLSDGGGHPDVWEERTVGDERSGQSHGLPASVSELGHQTDHDNLDEITRRYSEPQEGAFTGGSVASQSYRWPGIGSVHLDKHGDPLSNVGTQNIGTLNRMSYMEIEERQRREHDIRMQLRMYGQQSFDDLSQRRHHMLGQEAGLENATPLPLPYGHSNLPAEFSRLGPSGLQSYPMHLAENYLPAPDSIMREQRPRFSRNNIFNAHGAQVGYLADELHFVPGPRHPFPPHHGSPGWIND